MYSQIASNKRKTVLIMLFFLVLISIMSWVFSKSTGQVGITPFVLMGALVYALFSYLVGSKLALAINGAKRIEKKDSPELWRIVENLSITEGLPMPKVYVIDDPSPNAFATGRDPHNGVVCVTTGLLDIMEKNEVQGVLAHEMGHIKNYDIRVSMIAFALVAAISLLADILLRMSWFGGGDDNNNNNNQLFFVLGIVAAIIVPLVAVLTQMAVSRNREYLADATGALATRYPEGLASALAKIQKCGLTMKRQNTSTAHLFFANPLKHNILTKMFSTHPPIEERIKRLNSMGRHA